MRGKLDRVNFRKELRDSYYRFTTAASSVTIPETIAGRISAPVPFSLLKWRKKEISVQPQTVWLQFAPFTIFLSHHSMPGHA